MVRWGSIGVAARPGAIVGFVFGGLMLWLLVVALQKETKPGSRSFALFTGAVSVYAVITGINVLSPAFAISLVANKAILSCALFVGVGWLMLGLELNNRVSVSRTFLGGVGLYAIGSLLVLWANPGHVAIGADATMNGTYLSHTEGPWYWVIVGSTVFMVLGGTGLLADESLQSTHLRRKQTAILAAAIVPTLVFGLLTAYLLAHPQREPFDFTVVGYGLTGIVFGVAMFHTGFLDIATVARQTALGEIRAAMITLDERNRVVDCNGSARDLFSIETEWTGMQASTFFTNGLTHDTPEFWARSNDRTEVTLTIDGERRHFSVSVTTIGDETQSGRLILLHEITDSKRRERTLRQFKQAVEHAGCGIMIVDPDGAITFVNSAMVAQTGYDETELIGSTPSILQSGACDEPFFEGAWDTILDGAVWQGEVTNERKSGDRYTVDQTIAPITDESDLLAVVSVNHDITDRKEHERKIEKQRDGLDLLNQMVRHDIRNDLQIILGWAELLEQETDGTEREYAERILESAKNAVDITVEARQLAELMLRSETDYEPTPIGPALTVPIDQLRDSVAHAVLEVDGPVPATKVRADEMLSSVFRNLLNNAVQHNNSAVPEVTVSVADYDDHLEVSVAD
ncbi:MAG: histidine kinase N-terminal 7TM domain-containing protein, partial [Halobacteriota archaeon]